MDGLLGQQGVLLVKTLLSAAVVLAAVASCGLTASRVIAQGNPVRSAAAPAPAPAAGGGPGIVVIDINYIYENHERFKADMEAFKNQVQGADNKLKGDYTEIQKMGEQLKGYNAGSPDYKRIEEEATKLTVQFNVKKASQAKELMEREAALYYGLYREIQQELQYFAKQNNIRLILRFNREPVDQNDRKSVLNEINKAVVLHDRLDITEVILAELNRRGRAPAGAQPAGAQPAAARPTNQAIPRR
jgi:Skp family chaperone for outer membrane proteins